MPKQAQHQQQENDQESKPLTGWAKPPLSAVLSLTAFAGASLANFPSLDEAAAPDASLFTHRVFPQLVSTTVLVYVRLVFAVICFVGFITAWLIPP